MTPINTGPIVRIAEIEIDPEQIDAYRNFLSEEISASIEAEPGVLLLYAVSVAGNPEQVRVIEHYVDQTAYESHLRTPHFLKYKEATAGMVRSLRLIETETIALGAKDAAAPA